MESEPATNQRKPRSKVERAIVWSVILIMLVIVFFEWKARDGYNKTLNAISQASKASEEDPSAAPVTKSTVEGLVSGSPTKQDGITAFNRTVLYTWQGLTRLRTYTILVTLDGMKDSADPVLLSFETGSTESSHEQILDEGAPKSVNFPKDTDTTTGGAASPPGFSPAGDGQRPAGQGPRSWEDLDADGDGKITKEEAPERMKESFDQFDTNKDGSMDKAEYDAMRERFRGQRGGQNSTVPPTRPQRPAGEPDSGI